MRVLIACEKTQAVCIAFRQRGHLAFSCDLSYCTGWHPEWHIQGDVVNQLHKEWDLIIAHPPCTHLAVSGAAWFEKKRKNGQQKMGIDFFMGFTDLECTKVAIENPVGIMSTVFRKPDQIIHPWQFGHGERKSTCLWLKGLPKLVPTNIVPGRSDRLHKLGPVWNRSEIRSATFPGIAQAMAEQWG